MTDQNHFHNYLKINHVPNNEYLQLKSRKIINRPYY